MKIDKIIEKVVKKYRKRSKIGIKTYGTTLEENNADNFLNHLQEELMDGVNYIEKLMSKSNPQSLVGKKFKYLTPAGLSVWSDTIKEVTVEYTEHDWGKLPHLAVYGFRTGEAFKMGEIVLI